MHFVCSGLCKVIVIKRLIWIMSDHPCIKPVFVSGALLWSCTVNQQFTFSISSPEVLNEFLNLVAMKNLRSLTSAFVFSQIHPGWIQGKNRSQRVPSLTKFYSRNLVGIQRSLSLLGQIYPCVDPGSNTRGALLLQTSWNCNSSAANKIKSHNNDSEACGKKCYSFWFHFEVKLLMILRCTI